MYITGYTSQNTQLSHQSHLNNALQVSFPFFSWSRSQGICRQEIPMTNQLISMTFGSWRSVENRTQVDTSIISEWWGPV